MCYKILLYFFRERERERENIKNLFISFGKDNITLFKSRLYIKIII